MVDMRPTRSAATESAAVLSLALLAADGDVPALASLSTKKGGFSGADGTMEVDPEGSGATVESTLSAGAGKSADLAATITC